MNAPASEARYQDVCALVIGASTGIGRATAHRLAREGARVGVADLVATDAATVAAALPGDGHAGMEVDVRSPDSVAEAVARFASDAGGIDVLVHVAGGDAGYGPFEEIADATWHALLDLNLVGPVRTIRAALPHLRASRRGPAIAVVGSINAELSLGSEPYSAAKAGLRPLIGNLAAELGPAGIRINAVAPGTIRTRVWDAQGGPDRLAHLYPLGRVGEPEDVAAALAFLCSSDAAWVTGHVLPVDGGLSVRRIPLE
jgi:NAD(P)-dependent dehydrogenase (short-subunit alcohol dehydrogenase family)